jgi:2-methylcitrate dehydratase PrpD
MTLTRTLAGWASGLQLTDVPERTVAEACTQTLSQLGSIRAGLGHPFGRRITAAFGSPCQDDPRRAAHVLAALGIGLDYDDTAYAGHLSHSTVNVPLAYASGLALSGADLLTAVVAANECAARITAAATIGPFRGQSAAHTHLAGAVAGRLRAESAPASQWVDAWGVALSLPLWPLDVGFYGSDAKLFIAASPVGLALDACDAARHGLAGPDDVLEHPRGFLARFADVPLPDAVTAGLGERWHTDTFSFKAHPGSAYLGAAVAAAADLHRELAGADLDRVAEVVVEGSVFTVLLDSSAAEFVAGPDSPLSALNFSLGYSTATALLTGDLTPADFASPGLSDAARWRLAGKVRAAHDPELSRRALLATAPIGAALRQAAGRADGWVQERGGADVRGVLAALGPPERTFESGSKRLGARVTVRFDDGQELSAARAEAPGSLGWGAVGDRRQLVRDKFAAVGGAPWIADAVENLADLSAGELSEVVRAALTG